MVGRVRAMMAAGAVVGAFVVPLAVTGTAYASPPDCLDVLQNNGYPIYDQLVEACFNGAQDPPWCAEILQDAGVDGETAWKACDAATW